MNSNLWVDLISVGIPELMQDVVGSDRYSLRRSQDERSVTNLLNDENYSGVEFFIVHFDQVWSS